MPDIETLRSLLARVEAATGSDRELDGRMWAAEHGLDFVAWDGAGVVWRCPKSGIRHRDADFIPHYSASIDDVTGLIAHLMPERSWGISLHRTGNTALVAAGTWETARMASTEVRTQLTETTPALALLAALLKALIAMEEAHAV